MAVGAYPIFSMAIFKRRRFLRGDDFIEAQDQISDSDPVKQTMAGRVVNVWVVSNGGNSSATWIVSFVLLLGMVPLAFG